MDLYMIFIHELGFDICHVSAANEWQISYPNVYTNTPFLLHDQFLEKNTSGNYAFPTGSVYGFGIKRRR